MRIKCLCILYEGCPICKGCITANAHNTACEICRGAGYTEISENDRNEIIREA